MGLRRIVRVSAPAGLYRMAVRLLSGRSVQRALCVSAAVVSEVTLVVVLASAAVIRWLG